MKPEFEIGNRRTAFPLKEPVFPVADFSALGAGHTFGELRL